MNFAFLFSQKYKGKSKNLNSHAKKQCVQKNKVKLRFTEEQLKIVLDFCTAISKDPRMPYKEFHEKYKPYKRLNTTNDLLKRAYENIIVSGPFLFANTGIEVCLTSNDENPKELLRKARNDRKITWGIAMQGDWSLITFSYGANTLQHAATTIPVRLSNYSINDIEINEKGKLPDDPYPHGWDELDWKIFHEMRVIRKKTYIELTRELGIAYKTIHSRFVKILKQCKIMTCYFPLGYHGYQYIFLTFKTEYEIGLLNALRKLDRTSYLYKYRDMILLIAFLLPEPLALNSAIDRFKELEETGIIHDLSVSIPREWYNTFV